MKQNHVSLVFDADRLERLDLSLYALEAELADLKSVRDADVRGMKTSGVSGALSTDEALEVIARAEAGRAWLTHLSHESEHHELEAILPRGVQAAYDGLKIRS